jgi:hypothetical protein
MHALGRKVLKKEIKSFDFDRLKPAVFTLIALEEPENSLSPRYLGRIIKSLDASVAEEDAQALVSQNVLRNCYGAAIGFCRGSTAAHGSRRASLPGGTAMHVKKLHFIRRANSDGSYDSILPYLFPHGSHITPEWALKAAEAQHVGHQSIRDSN